MFVCKKVNSVLKKNCKSCVLRSFSSLCYRLWVRYFSDNKSRYEVVWRRLCNHTPICLGNARCSAAHRTQMVFLYICKFQHSANLVYLTSAYAVLYFHIVLWSYYTLNNAIRRTFQLHINSINRSIYVEKLVRIKTYQEIPYSRAIKGNN